MVTDATPFDWQDLWGDPQDGDWDLDEMRAYLPADEWEAFDDAMNDAYTEFLDAGGEPGSIPGWLLDEINEFLQQHGLRPQVWWAELYGR